MADWPDTLPGLNIKQALTQLGGKKALLLRLLGMFTDNHSEDVNRLLAAASSQDNKAVFEINHALKGVTANLAADELCQLCVDLDSKLKNEESNIETELTAMPLAMETLLSSIQAASQFSAD